MLRRISFGLTLLCLLSLGACKAKKMLVSPEEEAIRGTQRLWESVRTQNIDFKWYEARADIEVTFQDMVLGGKADIRIRKDSVIFMRVRKFGLEMARVLITPDSLFVINRLQSNYLLISIDSLQRAGQFPFGFEQLQEMLVGNQLVQQQLPVSSLPVDQGYLLKTADPDLQVNYRLDPDLWVQSASFMDQQGRSVEIEFEDRRSFGEYTVASKRYYYYPQKEGAEYLLKMQLEKMEIDQAKEIRFEIPSGYTRL